AGAVARPVLPREGVPGAVLPAGPGARPAGVVDRLPGVLGLRPLEDHVLDRVPEAGSEPFHHLPVADHRTGPGYPTGGGLSGVRESEHRWCHAHRVRTAHRYLRGRRVRPARGLATPPRSLVGAGAPDPP